MESFAQDKAYQSRLLWRDHQRKQQSKLLLAKPDALLVIAVLGNDALGGTKPLKRIRRHRERPEAPRSQ